MMFDFVDSLFEFVFSLLLHFPFSVIIMLGFRKKHMSVSKDNHTPSKETVIVTVQDNGSLLLRAFTKIPTHPSYTVRRVQHPR